MMMQKALKEIANSWEELDEKTGKWLPFKMRILKVKS